MFGYGTRVIWLQNEKKRLWYAPPTSIWIQLRLNQMRLLAFHRYNCSVNPSWIMYTSVISLNLALLLHPPLPNPSHKIHMIHNKEQFVPWWLRGKEFSASILARKILWTEEPGGLWSMGSQRDMTEANECVWRYIYIYIYINTHTHTYTCRSAGTKTRAWVVGK